MALGLIWRGDQLLVFEGSDPVTHEFFYRPLGGGIQFGESSDEALRREFREELDVEIVDLRYVGTLENIFTYNGELGHEIIQLYEAALADPSFYEREHFQVREEGDLILPARWISLSEFQGDGPPLYPQGLLALLIREGASP